MCGEDSQDAIKKYMTDVWDLAHEAVERAVFGDDDDDDVADDTDNFNLTEVIDKSFHAAIHSGLSHPNELVRKTAAFYHAMTFESDRGCILIAASLINEELESLLRRFFRDSSGIADSEMNEWFVGPLAPFQSTSVKIKLAFALGIINGSFAKALKDVQSLRSKEAAHAFKPFAFTKENVERLRKHLTSDRARAMMDLATSFRVSFFANSAGRLQGKGEISEPRVAFLCVMAAILEELVVRDDKRGDHK